jgi:DNA-binding MarR family transcriptional regulator
MTASGLGVAAILWAFRRVRNTAEITQIEGGRTWAMLLGYSYIVPAWIALNALVILAIVLARAKVPLVVSLIQLGVAVYLYYALRLSFSRKIPGEAAVTIGSLVVGSVATIALLSITTRPGVYVLIWGQQLPYGFSPEPLHAPDQFRNLWRSAPGLNDDEQSKRDVPDEAIRSLRDQLDDSTFKSSVRILILVLLALTRSMSSVKLRMLTGLGKGSLENHLDKLESFGYVKLSYAKSIGARGPPRQTVEITEKGLDACRAFVKSLSSLSF